MKILYLLHDFLPEHTGGTEVHTFELARELALRGHDVTIACTERDTARPDGDLRERRVQGLRVLEFAHSREYACAEDTWEETRQAAVFGRLLESVRPDILHVQHFAQWGTAVLRCAHANRLPSIVTLHDYQLLCANACLLRGDGTLCAGDCAQCFQALPPLRVGSHTLEAHESGARARRAVHRADLALAQVVISPSRFLAELMASSGLATQERFVHVESGVAGPWREPQASDPSLPLRLAYVGGIYPSKGVHVLIEAFLGMASGTATLDIHGVLEWFPAYVAHLRALAGGRGDISWHGRFAPEDIDSVLDAVDVLVVPSLWYENRPLTIQAAFRRGICVVVSDLGGLAELVVTGRGGERFPRGDSAALGVLLTALARDRGRVLALARGRPAVASIEAVGARHLELYARALGAVQ